MVDQRTAFVLAGGGSLGAVQAGMLRALQERAVMPDLLVGTSAGALNAAYLAGRGFDADSIDGLAEHWIGTHRSDCFPVNPLRHLRALAGKAPSLFADDGLRKTIADNLVVDRLEDSTVEVHLVATDVLSGTKVVMSQGDVLSAVLASSAIPGLLPPVEREGLTLVDGALADNAAISVAAGLGADRVFVLPTGYACALRTPPKSVLAVAMHSLGILVQQRLIADVEHYVNRISLNVLPPAVPADRALGRLRPGSNADRARVRFRCRMDRHRWPGSPEPRGRPYSPPPRPSMTARATEITTERQVRDGQTRTR